MPVWDLPRRMCDVDWQYLVTFIDDSQMLPYSDTFYLGVQVMFQKPLRVINWLLAFTVCLIGYQFVLLIQATEWSHIISLSCLLFSNYYTLFKLTRDRLVLGRAYKDELTGM
jgi:Putative transmembrane protein